MTRDQRMSDDEMLPTQTWNTSCHSRQTVAVHKIWFFKHNSHQPSSNGAGGRHTLNLCHTSTHTLYCLTSTGKWERASVNIVFNTNPSKRKDKKTQHLLITP